MNKIETEARFFAIGAHGRQKYGNEPYIYHLDQTVKELQEIIRSPLFRFYDKSIIIAAGYMHDTVEDCEEVDIEQIELYFGPLVSELVDAVTDGEGKNRHERKAGMYIKVQKVGPAAMAIKLADRTANVRNCVEHNDKGLLEMYRKEQPEFKAMLYNSYMDSAWKRLDRMVGLGND